MSTSHMSVCETSDIKQCTQKQAGEHRISYRESKKDQGQSCKARGGLHAGAQGAGR